MKTIIPFIILLFWVFTLHAQIINIPEDHSTIQAAINVAENGDTVLVAEGTYYENIRFKGKAITVASNFILDGDTSHISKTIIDGSQPAVQDSASTVYFGDGEDSTSVLCGLTITGGSGTLYFHPTLGFKRAGGGIFINVGSAGKIDHNIIRNNNLEYPIEIWGGGICVMFGPEAGDTSFSKSVIIQNNIITKNNVISSWVQNASSGGGIKVGVGNALKYGKLIIQDNIISYNEVRNIATQGKSIGGGMNYGMALPTPPGEYIIRNNIFSYNKAIGEGLARGGGMILIHLNFNCDYFYDPRPAPLVYNNIIHNNETNNRGGGIATTQSLMPPCYSTNYQTVHQPVLMNNTIVDNIAPNGAGIYCRYSMALVSNNILWNDLDAYEGSKEIKIVEPWEYFVTKYNLIQGGWPGEGNIDLDPKLDDGYKLAWDSPCDNAGIDSIPVESTWYYAPRFDFFGNPRPYPAGTKPDLGAIEDLTTGVKNKLLANPGISIYPNPMTSYMMVRTYNGAEIRQVDLIDITGRTIKTINNIQSDHITLTRGNLKNGLYLLRIHTTEVFTIKVLVK